MLQLRLYGRLKYDARELAKLLLQFNLQADASHCSSVIVHTQVVPPDTSSEDQEDDTGDERENIDELRRRNSDVSEDEGREMPRRSKVSNKALSKMKEKDVEASEAEGGNVVDWGSDEDVFEPVAKQSGTKSRTMKNVKLASRRPRRVVSPLSPAN